MTEHFQREVTLVGFQIHNLKTRAVLVISGLADDMTAGRFVLMTNSQYIVPLRKTEGYVGSISKPIGYQIF